MTENSDTANWDKFKQRIINDVIRSFPSVSPQDVARIATIVADAEAELVADLSAGPENVRRPIETSGGIEVLMGHQTQQMQDRLVAMSVADAEWRDRDNGPAEPEG